MVRPVAGNAGQTMTGSFICSALTKASMTGPMLPAGVESNVEQYLNMICSQPCSNNHVNACKEFATASSIRHERDLSEMMPASTDSLAGTVGVRTYCTVFMPPWASDLRFLVSYMAYSAFLNQVKMPGFQAYYAKELDEVPDVWAFADGDPET